MAASGFQTKKYENLPAGRYLLRLTSGDKTGTRTFVKN
jgi:hypothetical protein